MQNGDLMLVRFRTRLASGAPLAVREWTGRSALSIATTTPRSHFATAGTYRTRVSQMRRLASRAS